MSDGVKIVGPWRVTDERVAFDNPWINILDCRVIHPDGALGEYGVVRFKNFAIGVLPIDEQGRVTLVGQHRFPHDEYSWELPEGGGPTGVDPLVSAKRELEEETGLAAANWAELQRFDVSNSVTDEKAICYVAWDLSQGDHAPESSEALTVKKVFFSELLEMIIAGEISDSLTIVMTYAAQIKALRGALPEPICRLILARQGKT